MWCKYFSLQHRYPYQQGIAARQQKTNCDSVSLHVAKILLMPYEYPSLYPSQTNEVNQGDALEHNFSAIHSALLFPITHLLHGTPLQQVCYVLIVVIFAYTPASRYYFLLKGVFSDFVQTTQKSMLCTWSKLYKVFARCSALVATAEENICCEELCAKMTAAIDRKALMVSRQNDIGEMSKQTTHTQKNNTVQSLPKTNHKLNMYLHK